MAVPAKERTWNFRNNVVIEGEPNPVGLASSILWNVKELLVSNGCTVVGSCDGVAFGMDGVDRWTTRPITVVHNQMLWVVVQLPLGLQIALVTRCTTVNNAPAVSYSKIATSAVGFAGGTLTAAPSAPDEHLVNTTTGTSNTLTPGGSNFNERVVFHGMYANDGSLRWFLGYGGDFVNHLMFDRVGDPIVSKVDARVSLNIQGSGDFSSLPPSGTLFSSWVDNSRVPVVQALLARRTGPSAAAFMTDSGKNQLLDEYPMYPVAIASNANGYIGLWGRLRDVYVTPRDPGIIAGSTYPADGSRQWLHTGGDFVYPWDGSVPLVA